MSILTLCGSTKFKSAYEEANYTATLRGWIVLSVGHYPNSPEDSFVPPRTDKEKVEIKTRLDKLHLEKIKMSDSILVLNVGGYIGESTANEILFAYKHSKKIFWLDNEKLIIDKSKNIDWSEIFSIFQSTSSINW